MTTKKTACQRALLALTLLLTVACWSRAIDVKLAWDAKPANEVWTAVRIYERQGDAYILAGEVAGDASTITLKSIAVGTHYYVARSWNGQVESENSNEVSVNILPAPKAPTTLTITVIRS